MEKLDNLNSYQIMLLKAVHFLRHQPLDYTSANLSENYDQRELLHAITRERIRAIATGEAAVIEHNARVDITKEFKRAKAKGDIRIINTSSESSSSKHAK